MRIIVTGSRDWNDWKAVYRALNAVCDMFDLNYPPDEYGNTLPDPQKITVVHGACRTGADHYADEWALGCFLEPERHPADWKRYRNGAGPRRNAEMAALGADLCLAFQKDGSRGTQNMIDLATAADIPVRVVHAE